MEKETVENAAAAIKRAGDALQKWHNEKLGLIPCGLSFNELMKELNNG